ncbi:MAG: hypothetical protein Q4C47_09325, partial [Planctomycetia bacterium]|nr:hypothetical protein [Planctomycetia bacterium]
PLHLRDTRTTSVERRFARELGRDRPPEWSGDTTFAIVPSSRGVVYRSAAHRGYLVVSGGSRERFQFPDGFPVVRDVVQ